VGAVWGAFWCVCDRAEFQHPDSDPTTVFLCVVFDELGAVFEIWPVSFYLVSYLFGGVELGDPSGGERRPGNVREPGEWLLDRLAEPYLLELGNGESGRQLC